jgi:hypothetical protein
VALRLRTGPVLEVLTTSEGYIAAQDYNYNNMPSMLFSKLTFNIDYLNSSLKPDQVPFS